MAGTTAEVRPGRRGQGAHGGAGAQRGARHRPGGEPRGETGSGKGDLGSWGSGRAALPRRGPPERVALAEAGARGGLRHSADALHK